MNSSEEVFYSPLRHKSELVSIVVKVLMVFLLFSCQKEKIESTTIDPKPDSISIAFNHTNTEDFFVHECDPVLTLGRTDSLINQHEAIPFPINTDNGIYINFHQYGSGEHIDLYVLDFEFLSQKIVDTTYLRANSSRDSLFKFNYLSGKYRSLINTPDLQRPFSNNWTSPDPRYFYKSVPENKVFNINDPNLVWNSAFSIMNLISYSFNEREEWVWTADNHRHKVPFIISRGLPAGDFANRRYLIFRDKYDSSDGTRRYGWIELEILSLDEVKIYSTGISKTFY